MLGYEFDINNEIDLGGLFFGLVVSNEDPKALERVRVRVLGIHDMSNDVPENSIWANHIAPSKQNSGEIPDVGDYLYIMFMQKSPMAPCWIGWVRGLSG